MGAKTIWALLCCSGKETVYLRLHPRFNNLKVVSACGKKKNGPEIFFSLAEEKFQSAKLEQIWWVVSGSSGCKPKISPKLFCIETLFP